MMWAISTLTGNNRMTKALAVRYSAIPLESPTSSSLLSDRSSGTHGGSQQIFLPIDVEETVTCFCRKARRKERDGDQSATDTKLYLEENVLERKLPDADLKALVDLPAGLDYNEWLASHTLALFEHVNLVYGTISEFCTTSGCADMTGPGNRTYLWFDEKGKKTRVAAPQYIDYVMTFSQKTVSDELIFPTKYANEFPSSFESIARKILRLQFHVIAHLYAAHFREIALLGLHTHLNLTFAHLTALHRRFNLIDEKETDVLRDLEIALRLTDDNNTNNILSDGNNVTRIIQQKPILNSSIIIGTSSIISTTTTTTAAATTTTTITSTPITTTTAINLNTNNDGLNTIYHSTINRIIDGDATIQPICTQPESIKCISDQQINIKNEFDVDDTSSLDINHRNNSNNGIVICPNSGGLLNSSHIGNLMNLNNINNNNNINSNHCSTHHPIATNSILQLNSNNTNSNNTTHTTTTA